MSLHADEKELIEDWARALLRTEAEANDAHIPWEGQSEEARDIMRHQARLMLDHAKDTHGHPDLSRITRVTLVHPTRRREYEKWDWDGVLLAIQDNGTTLKVLPRSEFAPYVGVAL